MNILASGLEWFSDRPGGLPRYFSEYLTAWTGQGEEASALVRVPPQSPQASRPSYVQGLPLDSKNPIAVRRAWKTTFEEELKRSSFDVFNPHFAYYAWGWLDVRSTIPMVTHFHGPWAYESLVENDGQNRVKKSLEFNLQRWIERSVYRNSNRFIVLSQAFRDELASHYGVPVERIHIISGAVDTNRFTDSFARQRVRKALHIPEDRFVLLTVRRLARRMGLENLIHAMANLRESFPDVLLLIVGGGRLYDELRVLTSRLHVQDSIRFTNRVPDEVLPLYYQAADLSVVPTVALEGFGFVTVESMACGTPAAGTPIGGTKEILENFDANLLFAGATTEDLVSGLGRLLRDRTQIPSRSATRNHVLNHYTWDVVIPQIRHVFEAAGAGR
ncbi:glycosyltransferase family 4 protein [Alicyclobacillus sp. ALC3]|uniref:glycosyltransferase family 4 protein n=1 Tax=Alicyclobacillus sp. ALC3 TaxID=2796143 RepID=UPI002379AC06|nr:glycosyltransferase family 4 protein [Alicyclobacillus sp. ALC3]WDL95252.1 glycosyltransferase family 4 protein [Alicyclobacillus sp. ALC3]